MQDDRNNGSDADTRQLLQIKNVDGNGNGLMIVDDENVSLFSLSNGDSSTDWMDRCGEQNGRDSYCYWYRSPPVVLVQLQSRNMNSNRNRKSSLSSDAILNLSLKKEF